MMARDEERLEKKLSALLGFEFLFLFLEPMEKTKTVA